MRLVYRIQDSSTSSESEPESDSDRSTSSRHLNRSTRRQRGRNAKKRMSITTNQVFEIPELHHSNQPWALPTSKGTKRRFFQNESARWDEKLRRVVVLNSGEMMGVSVNGRVKTTENGREGTAEEEEVMDVEEEDEDNR